MTEVEDQLVRIWVIYDHPSDFPGDAFIAREWLISANRVEPSPVTVFRAPTLEMVRRFVGTVAPDAIHVPRQDEDDPTIVESWF